ncbi:hypothetical protein JD844_025038 [Phrynosoma platyrhinos]|uniref:RGS domain-containing protein n=1 Tax=Phrynosoma platyrhinos TaxID=52577 RepID=A0ABQ7SZ41_PHRPL|nr:hypothetical protein JD844_025038 [Phrynosoma platyrhinos]
MFTEHELLEELLTYDDLFLESFNAFLSLPGSLLSSKQAFPLRLHYDRLTGRLQELDGVLLETPIQMEVGTSSPHYGATDEERERTLSWTVLYLEYKLAKLLICPLDENYPVSRYAIRGYSRQSDGTTVSSIPSRFTSVSGPLSIDTSLAFSSVQSPIAEHTSRLLLQRLLSDSSIESTRGRLKSGWSSPEEPVVSPFHQSRAVPSPSPPDQDFIELHISGNCGKPLSGPKKVLQFDLDETFNSKEEHQHLGFSHGFGIAALQQLKEDILGTVVYISPSFFLILQRIGMDRFREFLHSTLGIHLLDFWIDCEDVMEQTRHLEATATQKETQMFFFSAFRSIQAKYMLMFPPFSQEQLGETVDSEETAFATLIRKQYDALRRLRSYWVPRFLIHHQRTRKFRFEDPEKIHNLLLWRKLTLYESAWERQSTQSEVHQIALQIFDTFLASYTGTNTGLSFSMLEYIRHLKTILSMGSRDLTPSTFEPLIHYMLAVLGDTWLHYLRHDITSFLEYCAPTSHFDAESTGSKNHRPKQERDERTKKERQNFWFHDSKGRGRHGKKGRKKATLKSYHIGTAYQGNGERSPTPQDPATPQNEPDLLSNTVVLNAFRKAAHKMQDVELERILELLQEVEDCQEDAQSEKRLGCATKLLDICQKPGTGGSSVCLPKELMMRLKKELDQGVISDISWNEIQLFLHSFVAPSFEQFWDEVSKWLKKYGLQEPSQIPEEHWQKLEPLLRSIAARVALRHLRSQKAQVGSAAATAQPTKEDKTSFWQAVKKAAEGWPTIEMLHFLKHLQLHGPPVLESGLHFLLEVQKFKNAHHAWPDLALLKKKVLVIRDCFLTSQIEPQLQVAVDTRRLGRAIRAAEQALQKEIPLPPPSLFDELKDSVFSILLPYWAAFQKHWLKRSPESAQKAPAPQESQQPLKFPPLRQPKRGQGHKYQDGLTYTFSISEGLTLQYPSREGTAYSKTSSSVFGNKKRPTGFQFPSFRNAPVLI